MIHLSRLRPRTGLALLLAGALGAAAQQNPGAPPPPATPSSSPKDVSLTISRGAGQRIPIALPPTIAPITAEIQQQVVDPFFATLNDDLGGHGAFLLTDPGLHPKGARPPQDREQGDLWVSSGAQYLLDTQVQPDTGSKVTVVAQLYDLRTLKSILGKRYIGEPRSARRIAHTLANDIVRHFTGKNGPFLTQIAFVSDRDTKAGKERTKEIWVMDWDGQSQRRATYNDSLSLGPDWFPDGKRVVYQRYGRSGPVLSVLSLETGESKDIPTTTRLNSSPAVSPDGKWITYCGSVRGNPEVFVVAPDGSASRRLTDSPSIDSTPRWATKTNDIAFTSNRQGSPQIFLMDAEGLNTRRLTFAGNWNDEVTFSPDGSRLAFACRTDGEFQICVMDLLSGQTAQISTGGGAHENPTWSPDGSKLAWEVTRGGSTQIVIAGADGSGAKSVTSSGNNGSPSWSREAE